ncbi:unnamed protein product [Rotaria sordida]|uniref:Uncharacterized protein n=1 Tax=Rotaria sordida TaxID=392033 RepID=A0A818QAR7_9BILA|nr:unnamed protein product [Rotaria sordida]CAF0904488.1 unnamed protein product [Rotaria sordida]CAF3634202.1 unnamed protein product [Rotaria sordida]CAF3784951.1 unnamed protein product [Rotaria sordida]
MEENENRNKFHIQEYECGQKTNLYRMDNYQNCINLSTMTKKSNLSFASFFRAFFFPDNYPLGVSSDYGIYQYYNIIQTGCIAISGALAFSALFRGMGVGQDASNYLAASIVWLLKDGAGMIGRIIFAWGFAATLDADCKQWHFIGDILNDIACTLDLITPYFRSVLLIISSVSNICRAITFVIHGSTRTVIFQHQARNNNVADITAKCSSLETMVSLVALFVNIILLSILPSNLIWPLFIILTIGHLWGNYKAKRSILFNVFNHQRFHLVCSEYFKTNGKQILSVEQVNDQEPILFKPLQRHHSYLGISLNHIPKHIFPSQEQLENFHNNEAERFLLLYDKQKDIFYALLKPYADNDDLIRLNFFIELISYARKSPINNSNEELYEIINRVQKQISNLNICLDILHENNNHCYEQFKIICMTHGYNFHRSLFNVDFFRVQ